jgi:hypothetical protein
MDEHAMRLLHAMTRAALKMSVRYRSTMVCISESFITSASQQQQDLLLAIVATAMMTGIGEDKPQQQQQ